MLKISVVFISSDLGKGKIYMPLMVACGCEEIVTHTQSVKMLLSEPLFSQLMACFVCNCNVRLLSPGVLE
jgi:hypothetical protein